jgi:pre-mRNA-splicing factor SYF1
MARRVKLFEGNPNKQILTYTEAVRTVDPMKAVLGKPHALGVASAKLYMRITSHHDLAVNARVIFEKAVQVNYKTVDNLAGAWCEWAEMEIRHQNFKGALELLSPLEAIYERIVDLRIATPQIIINYAWLLQVWTSIIPVMKLKFLLVVSTFIHLN